MAGVEEERGGTLSEWTLPRECQKMVLALGTDYND